MFLILYYHCLMLSTQAMTLFHHRVHACSVQFILILLCKSSSLFYSCISLPSRPYYDWTLNPCYRLNIITFYSFVLVRIHATSLVKVVNLFSCDIGNSSVPIDWLFVADILYTCWAIYKGPISSKHGATQTNDDVGICNQILQCMCIEVVLSIQACTLYAMHIIQVHDIDSNTK